jgi:plasmid stabilization system protein ParE
MRIEYHPALEAELAEVRDYYNELLQGLGDEFIDEFELQVLRISAMPRRWMVLRGDIRRALMKRFPYVILFRLVDEPAIRITVVKHEKRHPSYGLERK